MPALTGYVLGDAPQPEKLPDPPAHMIDTPTGVAVDPAKEVSKDEAKEEGKETPKDAERPSWLDPKFKTPEDMAKAYHELEKKQGTREQSKPTPTPNTAPTVDLSTALTEANAGEISEATYTALAAKGFTKDIVDRYVLGEQALGNQIRSDFSKIAGGEANVKPVLEWAKTALTPAEMKAYDNALDTGNAAVAKILFEGIVGRYVAANGQTPNLITTETVPVNGADVFESREQVVAAMSDKRYKNDPAYRRKVEAKLLRSPNV